MAEWARDNRLDLIVVGVLLAVIATVHLVNVGGFPQFFEDEATYVAQAWALQALGTLSHYTYWYDHPPAGWIQMGAWATTTFGWNRATSAVMIGREVAFITGMVSVALLYVLARRLGFHRTPAAVAVLLFGLSPLAVQFHRMALLDNMLMPWLLGAIVLALSPKRRLIAYTGSGLCIAVACLTKITSGFFLPLLVYLIRRQAPTSIRRYAIGLFASGFAALGMMWPLMAVLKGELFPEPGATFPGDERVSLLGTQWWVLFRRPYDGGSVLDATSSARAEMIALWLQHDTWLLGLGLLAAVILIASRRYRWVGVMYLVTALVVVRPAELSFPYVITYLPLAALAIGGVMDLTIRAAQDPPAWIARHAPDRWELTPSVLTAAVILLWTPLLFLVPAWTGGIHHAMTHDANANFRESAAWIAENVPEDATLLVDNVSWIDLVLAGRDRESIVWMYKLELDPEIIEVHQDWTTFDYVVSTEFARRQRFHLSQMDAALDNSVTVAAFRAPGYPYEDVIVRRVVPTEPESGAGDSVGATSPVPAPVPEPSAPNAPTRRDQQTSVAVPREIRQRSHVVVPGDTLWRLAAIHRVELDALVAANGITDADLILVGTVLVIPEPPG